jgi:NADPH:quinone reductase-like Zn-dependent oxidoreductase
MQAKNTVTQDESAPSHSGDSGPPHTMKALFLIKPIPRGQWPETAEDFAEYFELRNVPVPTPKSGQVLVKVERSPINPADLSSLKGTYDSSRRPSSEFTPGMGMISDPCATSTLVTHLTEGSGVVVANGGGILGWRLVGSRVATATQGHWAEYVCVPATNCIVLPDDVSFETGAR